MRDDQRLTDDTSTTSGWRSVGLFAVRYGIAGSVILAGLVVLVAVGGDLGAYGFASAMGAGLSVMLLNLLSRMSVSGDRDREREEQARTYYGEHGVWPDDEVPPQHSSGRRWILPPGVVTVEQEEREGRFASGRRVRTVSESDDAREATARESGAQRGPVAAAAKSGASNQAG
jgi:hypothetical protein